MIESLTVALPAYNEAANIEAMVREVYRKVAPLVGDLEVVVVNDGSRDETGEILARLAEEDNRLQVIEHPVNLGFGAAVRDGIWAASKDYVFYTDSDLQFDLAELPRFAARMGQADMVIGYRHARSDPWHRRLFGRGWSWLVNLLFGYVARDVDCAFKLFARKVIERVHVASTGATFSAEFLVRAKRAGFTIVEEPVSHYPRQAGSSTGARPDVILRAFRELVKLRWRIWFER